MLSPVVRGPAKHRKPFHRTCFVGGAEFGHDTHTRAADAGCRTKSTSRPDVVMRRCGRSRFPTDVSSAATTSAGPRGDPRLPLCIRDARLRGEPQRVRRARVRPERGRGHDRAESRAPRARRYGAGRLRARVRARHDARRLGSVRRDGAGPERLARGVRARRSRRALAARRREAGGRRFERPDAERRAGARGREPAAVPAVLGRARGGGGGAHPETTSFRRRRVSALQLQGRGGVPVQVAVARAPRRGDARRGGDAVARRAQLPGVRAVRRRPLGRGVRPDDGVHHRPPRDGPSLRGRALGDRDVRRLPRDRPRFTPEADYRIRASAAGGDRAGNRRYAAGTEKPRARARVPRRGRLGEHHRRRGGRRRRRRRGVRVLRHVRVDCARARAAGPISRTGKRRPRRRRRRRRTGRKSNKTRSRRRSRCFTPTRNWRSWRRRW